MPSGRTKLIRLLLLTLAMVCLIALLPAPGHYSFSELPTMRATTVSSEALYDEYGLSTQGYRIVTDKVKRNDTFGDILSRNGVPHDRIAALNQLERNVFDVRRIRAGNTYKLYFPENQLSISPDFVVYQKTAIDYAILDLRENLEAFEGQKPVETKLLTAGGPITHSLYTTLQNQDANIVLANALSEVFAWQVDFYRIMEGDEFEAVYEEEFVDGQSVGVKSVLAARFLHSGRPYYAFQFESDTTGIPDYYDLDGNSLRRPFLRAPLRYSRISSRYSGRRFHPVLKRYRAHLGTDYAAPTGTPIRATADGTVEEAMYRKNNGRWVKIRHNSTYSTGYLHMSRIADGIKPGTFVKQGQVIGFVGSTGLATGPHLCYRFWRNGQQVDPLREKLPETVEPIDPKHLTAFEHIVDTYYPLLEAQRVGE